jgi:rRNA maturation RNase YbeY
MSSISLFYEDVSFELPHQHVIKAWITNIVLLEGKSLKHLNYIFCSDAHLLSINQQYLAHDYYTDIITFDSSTHTDVIEGDIFISIDRVRDNAVTLGISFLVELNRVMAHGVLHLIGYDDTSLDLKNQMRVKEDSYLSLFHI